MQEDKSDPPRQPPEYNPRRSLWNRDNRKGPFSIGLAVVFAVVLGGRFYGQGMHDIGMIVTITIAAVVMFAFVAPDFFSRSERFDDRDDGRPDLRDIDRLASQHQSENSASSPASQGKAQHISGNEQK